MEKTVIALLIEEGGRLAGQALRVHLSRPQAVRLQPEAPTTWEPPLALAGGLGTASPFPPPDRTTAAAITCPTCQRERPAGAACLPCSRDHLATVSGALGESLRFARSEGMGHPEVQRRLALAEEEIAIMERVDLAPDNLAQLAPREKELAEAALVKGRALRQALGDVKSVEDLERVAAEASVFRQEFRLRLLQLRGVDLRPVMEVARELEEGRIGREEARARVQALLPPEEAAVGQEGV